MSLHKPSVPLRRMRDFARQGAQFAASHRREDLNPDSLETLGLVKLVENIGEAAGRVPADLRKSNPQIPWSEIIGTRNRLVHGYDDINLDVLWRILSVELPNLSGQLQLLLVTLEQP